MTAYFSQGMKLPAGKNPAGNDGAVVVVAGSVESEGRLPYPEDPEESDLMSS